jgi:hypothetical protein
MADELSRIVNKVKEQQKARENLEAAAKRYAEAMKGSGDGDGTPMRRI